MNEREIHIGNELIARLNQLNMSKSEFARRIGTSKQNVNRILEKQSIDTSTLLKYGEVLDYNFFSLFCPDQASRQVSTSGPNSPASDSGHITVTSGDSEAWKALAEDRKERIEELKERNEELKERIRELREEMEE